MGDPTLVDQVVLNLALNARDAMPDGGELRITTYRCDEIGGAPGAGPGSPGEGYAALAVADTGTGMDSDTLQRAFEPFFTSKGSGRGTGLGLATVQRIAREGGGDVVAESQPGQGSTLTVYFPRTAEVAAEPERTVDQRGRAARANNGRPAPSDLQILVVDDNQLVRESVVDLLRRLGHRVRAAGSGKEAIAIAGAGELDLVLSDLMMPGMDGLELLATFRSVAPDVPVLLMSGFHDEIDQRRALQLGAAGLLAKPFNADALDEHITRIVRRGPARASATGDARSSERPAAAGDAGWRATRHDLANLLMTAYMLGDALRRSKGPDPALVDLVTVLSSAVDLMQMDGAVRSS